MTKFIAIISGKGGVGKTTTAINLGCALTNFGRDVLLLDANLQTPHLALALGSPKLPHALNDVLHGKRNIRDAAFLHPCGVKIVPASLHIDHMRSTTLKNIHDALLGLLGTTEIVLLDTAPGFGSDFAHVVKAAGTVLIVTNPELPAVADAIKAISLAEECGANVLGVVVNRASDGNRHDPYELSTANIAALTGKTVLCTIPEDGNARAALSMKTPLVHAFPDSPASVGFKSLAAALTGQHYQPALSDQHSEHTPEQATFFTSLLNRMRGDPDVPSQAAEGKAH